MFIQKVKRVLSPAVRLYIRTILEPARERTAQRRMERAERRTCAGDRIKVAFLAQMPEIWDKQESVYEAMLASDRFDPWLVLVPAYDVETGRVGDYGDEKAYFLERYKNNNILLAKQGNGWIDLAEHGFDYVFYQRPYDELLPKPLRSDQVLKASKPCYIPYASSEWQDSSSYPRRFLRNAYFAFMEDEAAERYCTERYQRGGHKRFWNIGYPGFEKCLTLKKECSYSSVLWTPRWSYDPVYGGSHFKEYCSPLTDYPWGEHRLTVRPHPLMWSTFAKEGILSKDAARQIRARWQEKGIREDPNKSIWDTFDSADILISDRSSVIPMFFLTGKPIVYCPIETEYSWLFSTILPGLYLANSWEELNVLLGNLLRGDDPLRPARERIIQDNFLYHAHATEQIVAQILSDVGRAADR